MKKKNKYKNSINEIGFDNWVVQGLKDDPEQAREYLKETIKNFEVDQDVEILLSSLKNLAKAYGWTRLSKKTGISRMSLYNALSEKGNPKIKTLMVILHGLGYKLGF